MTTIRWTHPHRRLARPRRRTGLAVETMERRLVPSSTLPMPHAAAAVVVPYFPPVPIMLAQGVGVSAYPPVPIMPVQGAGISAFPPEPIMPVQGAGVSTYPPEPIMPVQGAWVGAYRPDPCRSQSALATWADGPVNDQEVGGHPIDPHPDPQPPPGGNGSQPIIYPDPSPPPGGNGSQPVFPSFRENAPGGY